MDGYVYQGIVDMAIKRANAEGYELTADKINSLVTGYTSPERFVDVMFRSGPYGDFFGHNPDLSLEKLKNHPQASMDLGSLKQRMPEIVRTPGQRINGS